MSIFDFNALLSSNLAAHDTRRTPLPQADAVMAQLGKPTFQSGTGKDGGTWLKLNVTCSITDTDFLARASRERAMITYGVMLDVQNGAIALGENANIKLGKLRAAAGVNGQSLDRLEGQFILIKIGHRPDSTDPSIVYDEVIGVAKP